MPSNINVIEQQCAIEIDKLLKGSKKEGINRALLLNEIKRKYAVSYTFIERYLSTEQSGGALVDKNGVLFAQ